MTGYPLTPDGRYFVVRGRLWRRSNPAIAEADRAALVRRLMRARRDVRTARQRGDEMLELDARRRVHAIKVDLGERGPPWWVDGAPDFNRHLVVNTPYGEWFLSLEHNHRRASLYPADALEIERSEPRVQ